MMDFEPKPQRTAMESKSRWETVYSSQSADAVSWYQPISGAALDVARNRLADQAQRVRWIEGDITRVELAESADDIWHDRAVFHFLTDPADRPACVAQVRRSVRPGGNVIVLAFGWDGPTQCSGLPVARYTPDALHSRFGGAFELLEHLSDDHHVPSGAVQRSGFELP